ncbi:hypothetical protein OK016_23505 [Vibrio chagasii]|nr:hypothetical protein [Vibrio chagasii]
MVATICHDLAPYDTTIKVRGLRWPVVDGKETLWRFKEGSDPYAKKGLGWDFYGKPDGKALIITAHTKRHPKYQTMNTICMYRSCS